MERRNKIVKIILWTARIWASLILAFFLFFLLAHIFGEEESGEGFQNTGEIIQFIFFPISTFVGLCLAWKWEALGGFIVVGGMIGLFILRPDLISFLFIGAFVVPGLLFIIYWYLSRGMTETSNITN